MTLRRFKDIVALKTDLGELIGFHARNLEVARLQAEVWEALGPIPESGESTAASNGVAQADLMAWNQSENPNASDEERTQFEINQLTINVTQICNLHCRYCAAGGDGTYGSKAAYIEIEKTLPQIAYFINKLTSSKQFRINFLGGEPLLYPEAVRAIADYSRECGRKNDIDVEFALVTNGTLISPEIANLLADLKCHVTVSLDGPPEQNDKNRPTRGGKSSTERTLKGLTELIKIKNQLNGLNVNSVFGIHNTDVMATYKFLSPLGIDTMNFGFAPSADDAGANQEFIEQMAQVADESFRRGGEAEVCRITQFATTFERLDQQRRAHNYCLAGKSLLQVDSKNRLFACNWFMNNAADELGQQTEMDAAKRSEYLDPLLEKHNCQNCWARHLCGGGCMFVHETKTGNKHLKDQQFCLRTRAILAKGIEIYGKCRNQSEGEQSEIY